MDNLQHVNCVCNIVAVLKLTRLDELEADWFEMRLQGERERERELNPVVTFLMTLLINKIASIVIIPTYFLVHQEKFGAKFGKFGTKFLHHNIYVTNYRHR